MTRIEKREIPNPLKQPLICDEYGFEEQELRELYKDEPDTVEEDVEVVVHDDNGDPVLERCHAPATEFCRRCRAPFCAQHAPEAPLCCKRCEEDYKARIRERGNSTAQAATWGCVTCLLGGILATLLGYWLLGVSIFIFMMLYWSALAWISRRGDERERRQFLAEGAGASAKDAGDD